MHQCYLKSQLQALHISGNRRVELSAGNCKAVLGYADSHSSRLSALDLTHTDTAQPRAASETAAQRQTLLLLTASCKGVLGHADHSFF